MSKVYATCLPEHYNEATRTCSQVTWVEDASGWLPELSAEDGGLIGGSIFMCLALCYLLRVSRRVV